LKNFFADGRDTGPSAKRGILFFLENSVPRAPGGKDGFSIFLKNPVPRVRGKGRRQSRIFTF
jgi:hypothetical protein